MYDEKRWRSELKTAYAKGFEEGLAEARAEIRAKARLETAKKCKELSFPIDVIVKITGLSEEVVANL